MPVARDRTACSGSAASSSTCRGSPRGPASTSSTASPARRRLWGRVPRVMTIHDLIYRVVPEAHCGMRALGMRVLVPAARPALAPGHRRLAEHARRPRRELLGVPAAKVDVVPLGRRRRRPRRADARGASCASASPSATAPIVLSPSRQAPAQEPAAAARGARADPGRAPPGARRARLSDAATSDELRRARGAARHRRRRALPRLGLDGRARGALRARRAASSSRRSTRASACRCSRRWPRGVPVAARTARSLRRGRGRRGAAVRPRATRGASPPRSSAVLDDPAGRSGCARPAAPRPRASRGRRPPRATLESYERTLAAFSARR